MTIAKIGQKIRGFSVLGDFSYLEKKNSVILALGLGIMLSVKNFQESKKYRY